MMLYCFFEKTCIESSHNNKLFKEKNKYFLLHIASMNFHLHAACERSAFILKKMYVFHAIYNQMRAKSVPMLFPIDDKRYDDLVSFK